MGILITLLVVAGNTVHLDEGTKAVSAFNIDEAITHLRLAKEDGPYEYADHLRLYEQLGIAYTYLGQKESALEAFGMLLTLDPGFAISYTLSPKVTFVFEEARKNSLKGPPPAIHMSWASDQWVDRSIEISLKVASDPRGYLASATIHTRLAGEKGYRKTDVTLAPLGDSVRVLLPPQAQTSEAPQTLQLYLTAYDERGNQVYLLGNENRPREISLAYDAPVPWYRKWWVWAIVGGVIAAGTGIWVYLATREPPDQVDGTFETRGFWGRLQVGAR